MNQEIIKIEERFSSIWEYENVVDMVSMIDRSNLLIKVSFHVH